MWLRVQTRCLVPVLRLCSGTGCSVLTDTALTVSVGCLVLTCQDLALVWVALLFLIVLWVHVLGLVGSTTAVCTVCLSGHTCVTLENFIEVSYFSWVVLLFE